MALIIGRLAIMSLWWQPGKMVQFVIILMLSL